MLRRKCARGAKTAMGQSRHFACRPTTSGLPLETDIVRAGPHVSKAPGRDSRTAKKGAETQQTTRPPTEAASFLLGKKRLLLGYGFNYVITQGRVFLARSEERLRGCCICPGLRLIHTIELKNNDARSGCCTMYGYRRAASYKIFAARCLDYFLTWMAQSLSYIPPRL
jgi:hypothetical protein